MRSRIRCVRPTSDTCTENSLAACVIPKRIPSIRDGETTAFADTRTICRLRNLMGARGTHRVHAGEALRHHVRGSGSLALPSLSDFRCARHPQNHRRTHHEPHSSRTPRAHAVRARSRNANHLPIVLRSKIAIPRRIASLTRRVFRLFLRAGGPCLRELSQISVRVYFQESCSLGRAVLPHCR
jgi:hypothetical protein